jgi:GT2 family glycosyltransferase
MTAAAVVVVNYNGGELLRRCLLSVLAQQPAADEVVVVDNASSDGSAEQLPKGVTLLRQADNRGFGAGVNAGLAATRAPFVMTLNPDTELLPGCLAAASAALDADQALGSVAPRVLSAGDTGRIDANGIGLTSMLGHINCDNGLREADLAGEARAVLGPLGGAALWRRSALERAGDFAEHWFLYWEDVDLALRLQRAGHGCVTAPDARVTHVGGGTIGRLGAANVFYMTRNHWPCLAGALPAGLLFERFGAFLIAPLRAAFLYARGGQALAAIAGILCGALLVPVALWRRRALSRIGPAEGTAKRLRALMLGADANRLAMKAAP